MGATTDDRHVRFGEASIFIFHMTLGDNPSVNKGAPLAMEPHHVQSFYHVSLEEMEERHERSSSSILAALTRTRRLAILKDVGFTMREIQEAEKDAMEIRVARKSTIWNMKRKEAQWERRESWRKRWTIPSASDRRIIRQYLQNNNKKSHNQLPDATSSTISSSSIRSTSSESSLPSICKNCATHCLEDNCTTRVGYMRCQGECAQGDMTHCPMQQAALQLEKTKHAEEDSAPASNSSSILRNNKASPLEAAPAVVTAA